MTAPTDAGRSIIARIPGKLSGAYHIRGTRVMVRCIRAAAFEWMRSSGKVTLDMVVFCGGAHVARLYPQLTRAQIDAAIRFRARAIRRQEG